MVRLDEILDKVGTYTSDADVDVIMRAYLYSARAHDGQMRRSGEPYLTHPMAVAKILAEWHMDVDTIATGFLHDTMEDCLATSEELGVLFGGEVAEMVDGVTKIGKLQFKSKEEAQAENFRKMVLAMSKDVRVIIVKLADRLHNMRTMEHMRPDKQRAISRETMDIFAPIANRLGLAKVKNELEDHCFRYLHPDIYAELAEHLEVGATDRQAYIDRTAALLEGSLAERELPCRVHGRVKSIVSVYRKMQTQRLTFDQVHDLLAFRVLVEDMGQCYTTLGFLHADYQHIPDRIKDYISHPKSNGYQSLHTVLVGPEGQQIEVQIRTQEMHNIAEKGIAAHWKYKEGHLALSTEDIGKIARLRELFDAAREVDDPDEFLEAVKVDLFAHEVFAFTPAGDVKVFPEGATALDFAYAVHTEVGHHCTGAKVNGRIVKLGFELTSGDTVEIITSPSQEPSRDWLEMAFTGRALSKIRRHVREAERESSRELGREVLEGEAKKHGSTLKALSKAGTLEETARKFGHKRPEQLYLAVGQGHLTVDKVVAEFFPEAKKVEKPGVIGNFLNRLRKRSHSPVLISGQQDVMVTFGQCCNPLPGEAVMGFITRGRGITVHLKNCKQLLASEVERRIEVAWQEDASGTHPGELQIVCTDEAGMLAEMGAACKVHAVNVNRMEAHNIGDRKAMLNLEVSVKNVEHLKTLMRDLEGIRGVITVERLREQA